MTGKSLQVLGTSVLVNIINAHGMFPTENFRRGVFNDAEGTSGEKIAETLLQRQSACYKCPIGCGRTTQTKDKHGEGPEYETVWAFGAHLGISDLTAITEANYACNELGLDTITMGSTIGCAMELCETGAWKENLRWGDAGKLLGWVTDTAYRRGIGAELALGSKRLAAKYGRPELAMQVKGMEIPAYDPRGAQGMALSYATSNRGGCHMRAYMIAPEILGHPVFLDRFSTAGKAEIVALFQDISALVDSAVLCRFLQFAMGISTFTEMLRVVTGLDFSDEELMKIGRRIYTLERLFNNRAGFGRGDDTLPPRFFERGIPDRVVAPPPWCGSRKCSTTITPCAAGTGTACRCRKPWPTWGCNLAGTIAVKFFGLLRRRVRTAAVEIEGDGLSVLELLRLAEEKTGQRFLDELLDSEKGLLTGTIILVNGENIRLRQNLETRVRGGDSVDLFSPAGGG